MEAALVSLTAVLVAISALPVIALIRRAERRDAPATILSIREEPVFAYQIEQWTTDRGWVAVAWFTDFWIAVSFAEGVTDSRVEIVDLRSLPKSVAHNAA
jgi:hypothetical protein